MKTATILTAAAGAALMYYLDPELGKTRRKLLTDKLTRVRNDAEESAQAKAQYAQDRAQGVKAEARARQHEEPVSDEVLAQRVRADMGHHVRHASSVEVSASDGTVTLRGPALRREVDALLGAVRATRGVKDVRNELEVHDSPGSIPGLQND